MSTAAQHADAEPILSVRDLRVWYGTAKGSAQAVDRVSLDIAPGEAVGLVGESGCGKSTLGRALIGLTPDSAAHDGKIYYRGQDVLAMTKRQRHALRGPEIGLIFQEPMTRLNPLMRIEDHFHETLLAHEPDLSRAEVKRRSLETLGHVGIPPTRFQQYPHEFSGGMRQRIMIALALVLKPKLLIADEPTTSLDVLVEAQILRLLKDLQSEFGTALLMITHNLGIVAEACDRMAVMYAGRVAEDGEVASVFAHPGHPYTRELLRSTISLSTKQLSHIPGSPPNLVTPPGGCRFHPRCPDAMQVCAQQVPVATHPQPGQRVYCWRHGPDDRIPDGGKAPLQQELDHVDEA
jgi:peptide/nickel transport system ATP-binding protein